MTPEELQRKLQSSFTDMDEIPLFKDNLNARARGEFLFKWTVRFSAFTAVFIMSLLLYRVLQDGLPWLSFDFLNRFPSRLPERAGIKSALYGSCYIIVLTTIFSVSIGVAAALYLEEIAKKNRLSQFIEVNIANLAGVPSLVYGILGLAVFVRYLDFGRSVLAAAATLALMILPVIIITSREALRTVPNGIRMAALALGATPWQTIWSHVLPAALPNILTGVILALSRALGEAAPLIIVGGVTYIAFIPESLFDSFTTMPIQIFNWAGRPQVEFQGIAAAGIIVMLLLVLTTNAFAIILRNKFSQKSRW
ncbi:MAG: phosphate ABC transporter permease PstA [Proteobacteria bacterium]|nr:phosphate ABC transporter permease PstA [Pseudomonadota bacterium]